GLTVVCEPKRFEYMVGAAPDGLPPKLG
ncbi:MAG: hypothetical protein QOE71_2727, partial [Pseudonocardiales bacterium]|nr:hypothetical protein [Pseudonocardiales bacterium]